MDNWALWLPNTGMWSHQSSAIDIHHKSCSISSVQGVAPCFCRRCRATTPPPPTNPKLREVCQPALLWARYWSTHPGPEHQQKSCRYQRSCKDKGITKPSSTRHRAG